MSENDWQPCTADRLRAENARLEAQRIDKAIEEAIASERERCARVAETFEYPLLRPGAYKDVAVAIAAAIRNGKP